MKSITKNTGEVITRRPSLTTCRYELANGQVLFVRLTRNRNTRGRRTGDLGIKYVYTVMAIVADSRKHAKAILRDPDKGSMRRQTGDGSLEALLVASRYVLAFAQHFIGHGMELQVHWTDEKRRRAYRRLLRHKGFTMLRAKDGSDVCIGYRNPDFYEWKEWAVYTFPWGTAVRHEPTDKWHTLFLSPDAREVDVQHANVRLTDCGIEYIEGGNNDV